MTNTPNSDNSTANNTADEKPKKVIVITDADALVLKRKLRLGQFIAVGSYAVLLVFFTLNNLLQSTGSLRNWVVSVLPLLIFVPGLIKQTHRTYSWICFMSLMYFVIIVPLLMTRWLWSDWITTGLICTLFISAMMTSRWLQYWHYYLSTQTTTIHSTTHESTNH